MYNMKKKLEIGALYNPKTLKPIKYVVTPAVAGLMYPEAPLFTGTEEECKEFVKNYKEEKPKRKLSLIQTIKYLAITKYYEHIFPIFSSKLEKERMQVAAFIVEAKNTKHWSRYQVALQTLKFGLRQAPDVTTVIKSANGVERKITTQGDSVTIEKGACPQGPVEVVPEVQAAIEALEAEAKNLKPWTGGSSPEAAFPLSLTDEILNEGK